MEPELPKIIHNVEACAASLKAVVDSVLTKLKGMQSEMAKLEQDLAQKRAIAEEQIANLRADIQSLRNEKAKAERETAMAKAEQEKEWKKVEHVKEQARKIIDGVFAPVRAA
jgi:chromosome segregation ATPase